jgi:hypothetical protein
MGENKTDEGKGGRKEEKRGHSPDEIDPQELARAIWRRRKFIAAFSGGVTILTLVVSFLMTPIFRSYAVILPINKTMPTFLEGSDLSSLIGLLGLQGGGSTAKIMAILQWKSGKVERGSPRHLGGNT